MQCHFPKYVLSFTCVRSAKYLFEWWETFERILSRVFRGFGKAADSGVPFCTAPKMYISAKNIFLLGKIYIFIPINWPAIVTPKFAKLILTKIMVTIWVCSKYREMVLEIMKVLVTVCDDTQNLNDTETEGSLKKKYSKPNPILLLIPNTSNLESNTFSM